MKLKKVACLGLAAMVALGALGCGSDNKAADNKAGSKVTGSVCLLYTSPSPRD